MSNYITTPPTPKREEITKYLHAMEFHKQRETYHEKSAQWYLDFAREMQIKASQHQALAEQAYESSVHYLELAAMAELKRIGGAI